MIRAITVSLILAWASYQIGYHVLRGRVLSNCYASQSNPNICTMYMKIVEDKQYLMMEKFQ